MAGGGGNLESGEPEFQIAPMIDVLLVMLIFFISITSMEALRIDQNITIPVAADAKKAVKERGEVIVNVSWNEAARKASFKINADQRSFEDKDKLTEELTKAVKAAQAIAEEKKYENKNARLVIRADKNTPSLEISKVMEAGAEAGIADIAFSAASKAD